MDGSAPNFLDNSEVSCFGARLMAPSTRSLEFCSEKLAEISSPDLKWVERSLVSSGCDSGRSWLSRPVTVRPAVNWQLLGFRRFESWLR